MSAVGSKTEFLNEINESIHSVLFYAHVNIAKKQFILPLSMSFL